MKRRDLIAHLQSHGCAWFENAHGIRGGGTPQTTAAPPFHATVKSVTSSQKRFVGIGEQHALIDLVMHQRASDICYRNLR
jgi:hypothetical protein